MWERLRDRFKHLGALITPTSGRPAPSSELARKDREHLVFQLQSDISRLQHQIIQLSNDSAGGQGGKHGAGNAQMTALERELDAKQRELSLYQARI
jgi:hypothetical protein